jgi:hypothetical protein
MILREQGDEGNKGTGTLFPFLFDDIKCLDYIERKRISDKEATKPFAGIMGEQSISILKEMPKR